MLKTHSICFFPCLLSAWVCHAQKIKTDTITVAIIEHEKGLSQLGALCMDFDIMTTHSSVVPSSKIVAEGNDSGTLGGSKSKVDITFHLILKI